MLFLNMTLDSLEAKYVPRHCSYEIIRSLLPRRSQTQMQAFLIRGQYFEAQLYIIPYGEVEILLSSRLFPSLRSFRYCSVICRRVWLAPEEPFV